MLPDDAVKEFIEMYERIFGIQLDWKEAVDKANRLFRGIKTIIEVPNNKVTA